MDVLNEEDDKGMLGSLILNNLGIIYFAMRDFTMAETIFLKSVGRSETVIFKII